MGRTIFGNYNREGQVIPKQAIVGTTAIVGPAPAGASYMDNLDSLSLQLGSDGTVAGAWLIEVSNNYSAAGPVLNDAGDAGVWSDVTAMFKLPSGSAIAAVTSGGSEQYAVPTTFPRARAFRVTFTPTAGAGNVWAYAWGTGIN